MPHMMHGAPFSAENPALHLHEVLPTLPTSEMACEGQVSHVAGPGRDLYVLATHTAHSRPSNPVYPALHWHEVTSMLAAGENELTAQPAQCTTGMSILYVPAEH